jgi:hypothetical protein
VRILPGLSLADLFCFELTGRRLVGWDGRQSGRFGEIVFVFCRLFLPYKGWLAVLWDIECGRPNFRVM